MQPRYLGDTSFQMQYLGDALNRVKPSFFSDFADLFRRLSLSMYSPDAVSTFPRFR
jgi:hypothetical protein